MVRLDPALGGVGAHPSQTVVEEPLSPVSSEPVFVPLQGTGEWEQHIWGKRSTEGGRGAERACLTSTLQGLLSQPHALGLSRQLFPLCLQLH